MKNSRTPTVIKRLLACFISACLLGVMAGCSNNDVSRPNTELPGSGATSEVPIQSGSQPSGSNTPDERAMPKNYDNYAEAYLDILAENRTILTNEKPSDDQKNMGLNIGKGMIAVIDVFGDETPELLCVYQKDVNVDFGDTYSGTEGRLYLKIFTYSAQEGVESVFDNVIYAAVGGEHDYCVYKTRDGELMMFLYSSGTASVGGFWPIIPNQNMEYDPHSLDGFEYSRDLVRLWYSDTGAEQIYIQYGKEISKDQYDKAIKDIMGNINKVLFQGAVLGDLGLRLYKDVDYWCDITPFEAENMTYDEAIAWLEEQIGNQ